MYFRKIQLQQFRSHVDTTLDLARLTFIRGANAAGKSSIEQAIQITLAGRADGTAADGKGSAGLIRAGQGKSLITLAVQQDGTERILRCALNGTSRNVVVTRPDDPQYSSGTDYIDSLIVHKEVLACLTNNRYFVDLDEDKQKSILARIILPKLYDWPEWVKPMVHAQMLKVDWSKTPFEIIDQAYDAAFKERTNVNRDVKNFKTPAGDVSESENFELYNKMLATRKTELEEARRKKASLEGDSRQNAALLQAAQERLAGANARLSREQQEIPGIEANMLSIFNKKEVDKVAKNAEKAMKLDEEIVRLDAESHVKDEAMKAILKLSKEPKCPTCGVAITEEGVEAILVPLGEAKAAIDSKRAKAFEDRKALGNPANAKELLDKHSKAINDMQRTKERIAEEQTAIRDAEAKIDQLKASASKTADTTDIDAEIATLVSNIEKGTAAVNQARTAVDLAKRIADADKEKAALVKRQADLNRMVEYFGADGVKAELLASSIGTFSDSMNWVLAQWDYTCHLSIEPYSFSIMFRDDEGLPHPIQLKHLSKSQRYRFATAFQVALAIVTGFRFVIVDEADIYDSNGRAGLFAAISSGELEQAIVMATNESEDAPDIDGAVFYRLEDTAEAGLIPTTRAEKLVPVPEEALA
jgi:uncharacterized protein YoxC